MPVTQARMKYADFLKIEDDGNRHEIIGGVWYMTPPPDYEHQRISVGLATPLDTWASEGDRGEVVTAPVGVVLDDDEVVQPDIVFISKSRLSIVTRKEIRGPPDLVIEILSPSTASRDRTEKRDLYRRRGVREYWLVDRENELVEIHEFSRKGPPRVRVVASPAALTSDLLPGFTLSLRRLFTRRRRPA